MYHRAPDGCASDRCAPTGQQAHSPGQSVAAPRESYIVIPSALLVLMVDPKQALYFGILIIFIQQFDGNILGPKILGDSTGLSSFWVIFSITIFGGLFGVLGMIVGVPIFAVFYAGVKSLVNRYLQKKNLPTDLGPYMTVGRIEESMAFTEYVPPVKKKNSGKQQETKKPAITI